jgi:guanylate kinase
MELNQLNSKLFLLSGPSGTGKTSIARSVMKNEIVSFTTRQPRQGEVDGKDYNFISESEFIKLRNNDGLAEWTNYSSSYYGVTMNELKSKLMTGDAFCVVDVLGIRNYKKLYHNCVSVFVWMPFLDVAESRMRLRGDSEENIKKRLRTYEEEINNFHEYDVLLDNTNSFQDAVEGFKHIIGGNVK